METEHRLLEGNVYAQACIYHIVLTGSINTTLLTYVDDMQIREDRQGRINLIGWLPDQTALIGLLNNLNSIKYGILSVKILSKE